MGRRSSFCWTLATYVISNDVYELQSKTFNTCALVYIHLVKDCSTYAFQVWLSLEGCQDPEEGRIERCTRHNRIKTVVLYKI